jgi:hypothetical protein
MLHDDLGTTAGRDATPGSDDWREAGDVSQLTVAFGRIGCRDATSSSRITGASAAESSCGAFRLPPVELQARLSGTRIVEWPAQTAPQGQTAPP